MCEGLLTCEFQFHSLCDGDSSLVELLRMVALRLLPWGGEGGAS